MTNLLGAMSSFFKKLKPKGPLEADSQAIEASEDVHNKKETISPEYDESRLRTLDERQLHELVEKQSEKGVIRLLQALTDADLQLRIVQTLQQESTLKRVSRSELSKKLKRAADKKLRETGSASVELKLQKLTQLSARMRIFLAKPRWHEAPELLSTALDSSLTEMPAEVRMDDNLQFKDFQMLRDRLKSEVQEYERTCAQMEEICSQLESPRPMSKTANHQLQERWKDLREKYSFPKNSELIKRYEQANSNARSATAQIADSATETHAPAAANTGVTAGKVLGAVNAVAAKPLDPAQKELREQKEKELKAQKEQRDAKEREDKQRRLAAVEGMLVKLGQIGDKLALRQTGALLRELQGEAANLRRWKREYPAQLDDVETQIKTLLNKRAETVNEAQWDSWARTDRATRIQGELEALIGEIEAETDPEIALKKSAGLTQRLFEYSKEMRELGSLERGKDHKIWEQFKTLSDRGWVICETMRARVLDKLKAALSAQAATPIDFTVEALSKPRATLDFKLEAFDEAVSAEVKSLQALWRQIGGQSSAANREAEIVFTKSFELYFRQLNLHVGKIKRVESSAVQRKSELLKEMKVTCEGKSSLMARTRVAKSLEERWKKEPLPESVAAEYQNEFEGYQARLAEELKSEISSQVTLAEALLPQAQAILDKIQAKNGTHLANALKSITALESELHAIEKHLAAFSGLDTQGSEAPKVDQPAFVEVRTRLQAIFKECKDAAQAETSLRAQERNRVIREAETLALSNDWESGRARFEELRALWKQVGTVGQSQDPLFELLLENSRQFFLARAASKDQGQDSEKKNKALSSRKDLIYSLEALTRFKENKGANKPDSRQLPFPEEERAKASGKLLEFGMKYKQVLALDPQNGTIKETRKIMDQWSKLGTPDEESLPSYWSYYLDRVHALLEIPMEPSAQSTH